MSRQKKPEWKSEAHMLGVFLDRVRAAGWTVYPEQCGYDAVLVAGPRDNPKGPREGDVVAVEAKLRGNMDVLNQIKPEWLQPWYRDGGPFTAPVPDWHVSVVGAASRTFRELAAALGVAVHVPVPELPHEADRWWREQWERDIRWDPGWPLWMRSPPGKRIVPVLEVDVPAGVPAPRKVTTWKVAAVRACLRGGRVTSADLGVDIRRFVAAGWVIAVGKEGRRTVYEFVDPPPPNRPDLVYPKIAAALRAEGQT